MRKSSSASLSTSRNSLTILAALLGGFIALGSATIAAGQAADKPAAGKPPAADKATDKPIADKPAEKKPTIHPEADRIMRETSSKLAAAKALSFKAEVWEDNVLGNHKVSTSKTVDVRLRRPDRIQVEVRSPSRSRGFWYDGSSLTLLNRAKNLYGTVTVPGTIDQVIDAANDKYNLSFPLEDFILSDPYASAKTHIKGGAYFGKVNILGTPCQHVAFSTEVVDWQLWVSDETKLPRKYVITYKDDAESPQVTALFDKWDLNSQLSDETFVFSPPKDANKIKVMPREAPILQPTGRN
jgi:hypothetical protein